MIGTTRWFSACGIAAVSATLLAMFTIFDARPLAQADVLYACIARSDGDHDKDDHGRIRLVSANEACRKNETRVRLSAAGPTGPTGPTGAAGPAGPQGLTGAAGPQGALGPVGPGGPAGVKGDTGPAGANGLVGIQGPQGSQGPTGPAGPPGPAGGSATTGVIRGRLFASCENVQNFQGYLVRIPGRAFNAFPEHDGHFQIDGVPLGAYTLSFEALMSLPGGPQDGWAMPYPSGLPSRNVTVDLAVNNGVVDVQLDVSVPACVPIQIQCPGTPACSNNGTCDTRGGTCSCAAGFVGVDCSVPVTGPGSTCSDNSSCTTGICQAGFCQDIRGTCSFYSGPTPTLFPDGAQCGGVPGMPSSNSFGRCFDGFCRQTVCVGNDIGLLDHNGGTPLSYTVSCGSDTCIPVNGGLQAICSSVPKQGAGSACISNDVCLSGNCTMGTCAP